MLCPKCNSNFIWYEKGGMFGHYRVNYLRCLCGWSKELYQEREFIPKSLVEQREKMLEEEEKEMKRLRKLGRRYGAMRKPKRVKFKCIRCGKHESYLTTGHPILCRKCRPKGKYIKKRQNNGLSI